MLVQKWTGRRDEGDCVPDAETLTRWIDAAEKELASYEQDLSRAKASPLPPVD